MRYWKRVSHHPVRWGIIGAGNIARNAVAPAIVDSRNGELFAVASRSEERAHQLAGDLKARRAYGSYESLLADPDIDAVYIGLPNGLHEEWTFAAARAGKHVLCEKSLTMCVASARRMHHGCHEAGVLLMVAYMYRHHPQWRIVQDIVDSGKLGRIRSIAAAFTGMLDDEKNHRWSKTLGGGVLFDVTCYGINACRYILRAEPQKITTIMDDDTPEHVDRLSHVSMLFPGNIVATAIGSLSSAGDQYVRVLGTKGRLVIEKPFIPGFDSCRLLLDADGRPEIIEVPGANHFLLEVEHFGDCLLEADRELWPAENGTSNVAACEAAQRSWRTGTSISLS